MTLLAAYGEPCGHDKCPGCNDCPPAAGAFSCIDNEGGHYNPYDECPGTTLTPQTEAALIAVVEAAREAEIDDGLRQIIEFISATRDTWGEDEPSRILSNVITKLQDWRESDIKTLRTALNQLTHTKEEE